MALDERDVELISFETARLTAGGWKYVGNGRWAHHDFTVNHDRRTALGLLEHRERQQPPRAVTERRFPALRVPTPIPQHPTPSPLPAVAPPAPSVTKPVTYSGTRLFPGFDDEPPSDK
jgi:hypothetical protein